MNTYFYDWCVVKAFISFSCRPLMNSYSSINYKSFPSRNRFYFLVSVCVTERICRFLVISFFYMFFVGCFIIFVMSFLIYVNKRFISSWFDGPFVKVDQIKKKTKNILSPLERKKSWSEWIYCVQYYYRVRSLFSCSFYWIHLYFLHRFMIVYPLLQQWRLLF